jgi:hypothetical protein
LSQLAVIQYLTNFYYSTETPPESGTEATLFDPSGNLATIAREETVPFAVVIVIVEPFVPELQNKRSRAFGNLRRRFLVFLLPLYRNTRGFLGIIFNSFSPGSVVADIEVLYNSTEPIPTAEEVQSPIAEARDNGSAIFNISSLQVEREGESHSTNNIHR